MYAHTYIYIYMHIYTGAAKSTRAQIKFLHTDRRSSRNSFTHTEGSVCVKEFLEHLRCA